VTTETADLWTEYRRTRSADALKALACRYLTMLHSHAEAVAAKLRGVTADELIADGFCGLVEAIEAFEPATGVKFGTFAWYRVRGAMLDGLRTADWVPRLTRSREHKREAERERLRQQLGREPNAEDLAACEAVPAVRVRSLHEGHHWSESGRLLRVMDEHCDAKAERSDAAAERLDLWRTACRGLGKRERLALLLYYLEGESMQAVGRHLGVGESRVSQMFTDRIRPQVRENLRDEVPA